jgi:hypothetical protein
LALSTRAAAAETRQVLDNLFMPVLASIEAKRRKDLAPKL